MSHYLTYPNLDSSRYIMPGCRQNLTVEDQEYIFQSLAFDSRNESALNRLIQDPDTVDVVLDHPALFRAVINNVNQTTLRQELYLYVIFRHFLLNQNLSDPHLAEFLAKVTREFLNSMGTHASQNEVTSHMRFVIDMMNSIHEANPLQKFNLWLYAGNEFLMITGLYPKFILFRQLNRGAPGLQFYESFAKRSFQQASQNVLAAEFAMTQVFLNIAQHFPAIRKTLNLIVSEFVIPRNAA